jgi:hypothetical protein
VDASIEIDFNEMEDHELLACIEDSLRLGAGGRGLELSSISISNPIASSSSHNRFSAF